jgi:DNA-binding PadR family transcriptional regulator
MSIDISERYSLGEYEHHHGHHFGFAPINEGMGRGFGVRRGEFRFLVLIALSERPMHGYGLIQEIGRTYQRPVSAGLVYPTLQELEDMGYVVSKEKDGKKVYSITIEGKNYLGDNEEVVDRLKAGQEYADKIGQFDFVKDLRDIQAMLMVNTEYIDNKKMKRIQEAVTEAKRKVASIVFG